LCRDLKGEIVKKILSSLGMWAVLGSFALGSGWVVISPATPAYATDTATYLGVVEVDCTAGQLRPQTIVFTGGVGDTFKLLSDAGTCTMSTTSVLTGEPTQLLAGVPSPLMTVVSAGEFVISDATSPTPVAVTFKTVAGPVFANHNRGAMPEQLESFSCNRSTDSSRTIYFQAIGDTLKLENDSGSQTCTAFSDATSFLTGMPNNLGTDQTSGVITINGPGVFTATTSTSKTITFRVVEGVQTPIGADLAVNGSVNYPDVFYSVATGVVDAKVTLVSAVNIVDQKLAFLDDTISPSAGNWALAPDLSVDVPSDGEGSATIRIEFFRAGTTTPVSLSNLSATVVDIDNNQFVAVTNVDSYQLSSTPTTALVASVAGNRLTVREPVGEGSNDTEEDHWVVMNFNQASSLEFTVGDTSGGASFGISFAAATWSVAPATVAGPGPAPVVSTPAASPVAAPAASPVVRTLATTGVSEQLTLGILGSTAVILIGLGAFLARMRRKLS
jgi:hypothetical protein